ncbi:RNA polymerase sigma factor [Bacillus sp. FJAT-49736]|uniref:RNA polymerase sigma factor n=1 Tax=Bacillus sp. FJAT-49736 TaxID=2833582 RepID=UPI001BC951A2|nr:RNA polymerase sigma factor [Bacillus sp. FJAT-49736]MBS4174018.1 RNA polymerase sigma factor [Bacillus sp. FJAT-49736]
MYKTEMQLIGEESKDIWGKFWNLIQPYRHELWHYCLKLTGSPWDAEDLVQDTVLKSFASLSALSHREQPLKPKPYLFRVATNHWLDQCRKKGLLLDENLEEKSGIAEDLNDQLEIGEVIEGLLRNLAPRQAVVFILMESFRFTAKEVAELIATTEGAVHAMLHRARKRLQTTSFQDLTSRSSEVSSINKDAIQLFIEKYNQKDFRGLANLIIDEATYSFVEMGSTEYGKETITKYSLNPDKERKHESVYVHSSYLWDKPALIFVEKTEDGERLFDINTIEWKNGKIEKWKCYYFCRNFMEHAADELKLPLAPIKF